LMDCIEKKCFFAFLFHSHREEMQKSKMAVWGGLTNSCEKKRSEKQRRIRKRRRRVREKGRKEERREEGEEEGRKKILLLVKG